MHLETIIILKEQESIFFCFYSKTRHITSMGFLELNVQFDLTAYLPVSAVHALVLYSIDCEAR